VWAIREENEEGVNNGRNQERDTHTHNGQSRGLCKHLVRVSFVGTATGCPSSTQAATVALLGHLQLGDNIRVLNEDPLCFLPGAELTGPKIPCQQRLRKAANGVAYHSAPSGTE
jgi:hypothetical protein